MPLREIVKLPLHIERADGFAVLEIDNPFPRRIAGDVASAANGVVEDEIAPMQTSSSLSPSTVRFSPKAP